MILQQCWIWLWFIGILTDWFFGVLFVHGDIEKLTTIPDKVFETKWNNTESSETGQEKKSLVSLFAYFLTAIDKI